MLKYIIAINIYTHMYACVLACGTHMYMCAHNTDHIPVGVDMIQSRVREVSSETLVEPEVIPRGHCYKVTKPLCTEYSVYASYSDSIYNQ